MLSKHYQPRDRQIVSESFDGEVVVLDLSTGKYFSFTDSGSTLWDVISTGHSPQTLVEITRFQASDVAAFIAKLVQHQLVVESNDAALVPSEGVKDRIAATNEHLDIFVFDDLTDLFLADPVHDVDVEKGWPVKPPN